MAERRQTPASSRLQRFLDSQRGLASFYATEGKQIAAAWTNQGVGDSRPQSPMLVPRAAADMDDEHCATSIDSPSNKCEELPQRSSYPVPRSSPQKRTTCSKTSPPRQIKSRNSGRARPKRIDRDLTEDDASERSKRLEQRRNRRRTRRSMMDTVENSTSETASSQGHMSQPKMKRQKDIPKAKSKRAKAAPALLLMQTFSGQNVGKSRLTMKPSTSVGVFNKGKVSTKISTKSSWARKTDSGIAFSESAFLNKTHFIRSNDSLVDSPDDPEVHSNYSLEERTNQHKIQLAVNPSSSAPLDKESLDEETRSNSPSLTRSAREASPLWDVESNLTDARDANSLGSLPAPASNPGTPVFKVNRCSWSTKLGIPEAHTVSGQGIPAVPPVPKPSKVPQKTTSSYFRSTAAQMNLSIALSPPLENEANSATDIEAVYPPATPQRNCADSFKQTGDLGHRVSVNSPSYMHGSQPYVLPYGTLGTSPDLAPDEPPFENGFLCVSGMPIEWQLQEPKAPERLYSIDSLQGFEYAHLLGDGEGLNFGDPISEYDNIPGEPDASFEGQEDIYYEVGGYDEGPTNGFFHEFLDNTGDRSGALEILKVEYDEAAGYRTADHPNDNDRNNVYWATAEGCDRPDEETGCQSSESEPELKFEDPVLFQGDVPVNHNEEATPRLVRIITENSLEKDLIKSISGHWGVAHRLH